MNTKPYEVKVWYTAIIEVEHVSDKRPRGFTRTTVLGRFATAADTRAAIMNFAPKKGVFGIGYVCKCDQTGWCDSYGGAEVEGNYTETIRPSDRTAKAA